MHRKNVIRYLSDGILASGFPKFLVTPNTALQQPDFLRSERGQKDDLSKLFQGIVCCQAENAGLA